MAGLKSVHVRISGRVQGVWFRGWTVEQARRLGLRGWVRNRADGTVEAVFQGSDAAVETMLKLCREGPPSARVGGVTVEPSSPKDFDDFQQQPTA
ncbi:MAG: acylphosphatase [Rhodospirillales bacterium]|jgi:acylphosphatase|nr:acylphosphatase [Rhodospirillales bacterium]